MIPTPLGALHIAGSQQMCLACLGLLSSSSGGGTRQILCRSLMADCPGEER